MSNIIVQAKEIVKANGFDQKITLIKGKMEDIVLPVDKVDIIISEWMGYCLLYESMLNTVIYARDKYLAPGGKLFPDHCNMFIAAIEDGEYKEEKISFWDNVYGFDMKVIKDLALHEPLVDTAVVTDAFIYRSIDLNTVTVAELAFSVPFSIKATRNDHIHAFISYFDTTFSACHKPITFSTGPHATYTHWKQTVFYLKDPIAIHEGECVQGVISIAPNKGNERDLDIRIQYQCVGEAANVHDEMEYKMC